MRRTLVVPSWLALSLVTVLACTRTNPGFGPDSAGTGSGESTGEDPTDPSASATTEPSGSASQSTSDPTSDPTGEDTTGGDEEPCGNGVKEPDLGEQCDDGDGNGPGGFCDADCTKNCGDGELGPNEPCDDGPNGSETCTGDCHLRSCGDGVVQEPEECDDENEDDTDACVFCLNARCGDSHIREDENVVEACDDGNMVNEDACTAECVVNVCADGFVNPEIEQCEPGLAKPETCTDACTVNECGDLQVLEEEECEEGDVPSCMSLGLAGANPSCYQCQVQGCTPCGNGMIDEGEECEPNIPVTCETFGLDPQDGEGAPLVCSNMCEPNLGPCCVPVQSPCEDGMDVECCDGATCTEGFCAVD